jgi:hypothetical protein
MAIRLTVAAVFQIRIPVDGVKDLDRLLNQRLGIEAPPPDLCWRYGLGPRHCQSPPPHTAV